jgi:hypothetical protein
MDVEEENEMGIGSWRGKEYRSWRWEMSLVRGKGGAKEAGGPGGLIAEADCGQITRFMAVIAPAPAASVA